MSIGEMHEALLGGLYRILHQHVFRGFSCHASLIVMGSCGKNSTDGCTHALVRCFYMITFNGLRSGAVQMLSTWLRGLYALDIRYPPSKSESSPVEPPRARNSH